VVRHAICEGMGIGYSPEWLFESEIASGELQVLLPDWLVPSLPVHLVSPQGRHNSAKVKVFGDHVARHMR